MSGRISRRVETPFNFSGERCEYALRSRISRRVETWPVLRPRPETFLNP